jgi:hypothetical protein
MATRLITNRYELEVVINGESVDWSQFTLNKIEIFESAAMKYPTGQMQFACGPRYAIDNPPVDGATVHITLNDNQVFPSTGPQLYKMRVFNSKMMTQTGGYMFDVSMRLDAPDLYVCKIKSYGKTSSSSAIAQCAGDAGLSAETDASSDTQYWLRTNEKGIDFITDTAHHAWANKQSCFVTAILANGSLREYNVTQRSGQGGSWLFANRYMEDYNPPANTILFDDALVSFETVSGTLNSIAGYGVDYGEYDLDGGFHELSVDLSWLPAGAMSAAKNMMGNQRSTTCPYKSDNQHENYNLAGAQNLVFKSLYSSLVKITTRYPRNAQLLDSVMLEPHSLPLMDGILTPWAGAYFVSGVNTLINMTAVSKMYTLIRMGNDWGGGLGLID